MNIKYQKTSYPNNQNNSKSRVKRKEKTMRVKYAHYRFNTRMTWI